MLYAFQFVYSSFSIDAAQDGNGDIWISTPTISDLLELSSQRRIGEVYGSKSFKRFAGEDFSLVKFSSKTTKANTRANFYSKDSFFQLLYYFCNYQQDGNSTSEMMLSAAKARQLVFSGFVADFEGSVQNALGTQLSEEQREYLRCLVYDRIEAFRAWTDLIRDRYIKFYGKKPEGWYYGKLVKTANLALFGVENFGCDRTANMTKDQQETIKDFERFLVRQATKFPNFEPEALLIQTLDRF